MRVMCCIPRCGLLFVTFSVFDILVKTNENDVTDV